MNAFELYQKYIAIKLHFSSEYNYHKYSGKVNVKRETFERRRDKYFFEKLRKKYNDNEIETFLVANFMINDNIWVGKLLDESSQQCYLSLLNKQQQLTHIFSDELSKLVDVLETDNLKFDDLFIINSDEQHPLLLRLFTRNKISIETLLIMNSVLNFFSVWDKKIKETYIWPNIKRKCDKYFPFIKPIIDIKKFKEIMKDKIL